MLPRNRNKLLPWLYVLPVGHIYPFRRNVDLQPADHTPGNRGLTSGSPDAPSGLASSSNETDPARRHGTNKAQTLDRQMDTMSMSNLPRPESDLEARANKRRAPTRQTVVARPVSPFALIGKHGALPSLAPGQQIAVEDDDERRLYLSLGPEPDTDDQFDMSFLHRLGVVPSGGGSDGLGGCRLSTTTALVTAFNRQRLSDIARAPIPLDSLDRMRLDPVIIDPVSGSEFTPIPASPPSSPVLAETNVLLDRLEGFGAHTVVFSGTLERRSHGRPWPKPRPSRVVVKLAQPSVADVPDMLLDSFAPCTLDTEVEPAQTHHNEQTGSRQVVAEFKNEVACATLVRGEGAPVPGLLGAFLARDCDREQRGKGGLVLVSVFEYAGRSATAEERTEYG